MKVLVPVHHFPPRSNGGVENYTLRLARWLQSHGHEAEVICIEAIDQGPAGQIDARRETCHGLTVWRLAFDLLGADKRWSYDNPLLGDWFRNFIERSRPDI